MNWIQLKNIENVDELVELSFKENSEGILIFKHSTRCSISSMALNRFEKAWDLHSIPSFFIDLISFRSVSNYVADKFSVEHESPQVLFIKNGKCLFHLSHNAISVSEIKREIGGVNN